MNNPSPVPLHTQDASVPPRGNSTVSLVLGALVSLVALYFILRSVDLGQTLQALSNANLLLIFLAFLAQLASMAFTTRRWQALLRPYPTHFFTLAQIFFTSHLLNTLLPAKLGSVARVLLPSEAEKLNVGLVFGSVAIEKVLDTLVGLVLLVALSPFIPLPNWIRDALNASVLVVIVGLVAVASVARFRETLLDGTARLEARLLGRESHRLTSLARGVIESMVTLTRRREVLSILFWTLCVWLEGGLVNFLVLKAVGIDVSWSAYWFIMLVLQIGTRVPALPANLLVFHYLVILALGVYGVGESSALAFAILLHLAVYILPALVAAVWALPLSARLVALVTNGLPQLEVEHNEN